MKKVLVADGERPILDIVRFNLAKEGCDVYTAYDEEETLEKVTEVEPDLILLDLMLPKMDGLEVAREVHKTYDMPIIMVTVKDSGIDKVLGLELGAGDYVTKSFSNQELVTRAEVNPRRGVTTTGEPEEATSAELTISDLTVHPEAHMVTKRRETIGLTHREFELFFYLMKHLGQVMMGKHLLQAVWGYDYFGDVRTVDVTVHRPCEKTEDSPSHPNYLVIRCGVDYYLRNSEQEQLDEKKSPSFLIDQL